MGGIKKAFIFIDGTFCGVGIADKYNIYIDDMPGVENVNTYINGQYEYSISNFECNKDIFEIQMADRAVTDTIRLELHLKEGFIPEKL